MDKPDPKIVKLYNAEEARGRDIAAIVFYIGLITLGMLVIVSVFSFVERS